MRTRITVLLCSTLAILCFSSDRSTIAQEKNPVVVEMQNKPDHSEFFRQYKAALELFKQQKYAEAEVAYKQALEMVPPEESYRVYDLNADLLCIYTQAKQLDKLHEFLHNKELLSQFASRRSAYWSSALVSAWLERGFDAEASDFAAKLITQLEWGDEPEKDFSTPRLSTGVWKRTPAQYRRASYNVQVWAETCNKYGKPEVAEQLFDACIKAGLNSGKERTEEYAMLNSLAATQSLKLEHFPKVYGYFETALAVGKYLKKPLFGELFTAAQNLLPKNVDMAAELYTKLFPFAQDKMYVLTIKLDLAKEFAKQNQKQEAKQLAKEVAT